MKTRTLEEMRLIEGFASLPVATLAEASAVAALDASAAIGAGVIALEQAVRSDKRAAVWAVDVLSDLRRAGLLVLAAIERLDQDAPTRASDYSDPIGGVS